MTTTEILDYAASQAKDHSTEARKVILGGVNKGLMTLRKKLKRQYANVTRTFALHNQAVYQLPEDCIRPKALFHIDGGRRVQLDYIDSERQWNHMKEQVNSSGIPTGWRMTENDLIEIVPRPSEGATAELQYQARAKPLKAEDYTTGKVAVDAGSAVVTGTGTTFAASMVGKYLKVTGGDEAYYRIIQFNSPTQVTLENYYDGASITDADFIIGDSPNVPQDYHYALADAGLYNYYLWVKDKDLAEKFQAEFLAVSESADGEESSPVVSNVIESRKVTGESGLPFYKRTPRAINE